MFGLIVALNFFCFLFNLSNEYIKILSNMNFNVFTFFLLTRNLNDLSNNKLHKKDNFFYSIKFNFTN